MLIAHYIGPPKPGILAHLGWRLAVLGQKGPHDQCTHTEAIHWLHADGTVTIASSSLVDKGVRIKERVRLTPEHWVITDMPMFDVTRSIAYFDAAIAAGVRYDKRGALATLLPGKHRADQVFCTESVLTPFVPQAHYFTPAACLALCLGLGSVVQI